MYKNILYNAVTQMSFFNAFKRRFNLFHSCAIIHMYHNRIFHFRIQFRV